MEQLLTLAIKFFTISLQTEGALLCLLVMLIYLFLPEIIRQRIAIWLDFRPDRVFGVLFALYVVFGLVYLAYPNYLDHVESTIAHLGQILRAGESLYPLPEYYPYHGLLYGPALAWVQALVQTSGIPVILASKLPGLTAFVVAVLLAYRLCADSLARGYLIYLLPFGIFLMWDRAEPLFLLMVSLTLWVSRQGPDRAVTWIMLGLLAGLVAALKLHGVLYVLAAYLAASRTPKPTIHNLVIGLTSAVAAFLACFLPSNISLAAFLAYLRLASAHGLSHELWVVNLLVLAFLWLPIYLMWRETPRATDPRRQLLAVLALEFLVTILAAKPGSGSHHLLPFIPVHAYLMAHLFPGQLQVLGGFRVLYATIGVQALAILVFMFQAIFNTWQPMAQARAEVQRWREGHPGLVMGLTDDVAYPFTFYRLLLDGEQIDAPSYMDLHFSGVDDATLTRKMVTCQIPTLLLPVQGEPFSMNNWYVMSPLFSDQVRQAFAVHYTATQTGSHYALYTCHKSP